MNLSKWIATALAGLVGALPGCVGEWAGQAAEGAPSAAWGAEIQVSDTGALSSGAVGRTLAVDASGTVHIVWTELSNNRFEPFYARSSDGGATWSAGRDVGESPVAAFGPNVAVGPDEVLHLVWHDRRGGGGNVKLFYRRSSDGGLSWETPRELVNPPGQDVGDASLSVDTRGRVHLAWHVGDPNEAGAVARSFYARSLDGGDTFEPAQQLNTANAHAAFPRFTVQGTDGQTVAIAWRDNRRDPDWDVYVAVSQDGGATFSERVGVATPVQDWDPEAMVAPDGVIHLSWMTVRNPGFDIAIDVARSSDGGRSWSAARTLSEASSRFPSWAPDHAHGAIWLFWKDEGDFGTEACPAGRNRCSDIVGKFSTDGGLTWSAQERVTDLGAVEVKLPSFVVGPDGRPAVMWSDTRLGAEREAVFFKARRSATAEAASHAAPDAPALAGAFLAPHLEVSSPETIAAAWPNLVRVMDEAGARGHAVTLMFSPQWAEFVFERDLLETVHAWEDAGHEIALHHHGPSHATFDGYTNAPGRLAQNRRPGRRPLEGDMDALMAWMAPLSQRGMVSASMTDEDVDWPRGFRYNASTPEGSGPSKAHLLSVPIQTNYTGQPVVEVSNSGYAMGHIPPENLVTLADIEAGVDRAGADELMGLVINDDTLINRYPEILALFDLLDRKGVRLETLGALLAGF